MNFINKTTFSTLCFQGLDLENDKFQIAVLKVGYRLQPTKEPGHFVAEFAEDSVPLCMKDEHYKDVSQSEVREESDLAHYKPRCDVIFRGSAYAPRNEPASQWDVRIKVSASTPSVEVARTHRSATSLLQLGPALQARGPERRVQPVARAERDGEPSGIRTVLIDKKLRVTGKRDLLRRRNEWQLETPQLASKLPMRWEHAFGGACVVRNPRYLPDTTEPEFLLNEVCFCNPLGCGWTEYRYADALKNADLPLPERMAAPQIEAVGRPFSRPVECRHPDKIQATNPDAFIQIVKDYGFYPEGLGVVGRPWAPRLQLAGAYDERWKEERWPGLPEDFDFGYWNCAPGDQQTDVLPPDSSIELWNLADSALTANGRLSVNLPNDWPFLHIYLNNGLCLPLPMMTDTLIIDTDTMMLTLTHRIAFVEKPDMDRAEVWLHRDLPERLPVLRPQSSTV